LLRSGTAGDVPVAAEVDFVKIKVYSYFDGDNQWLQNTTGTWISTGEQWILCGGKTTWSVDLDTNSWTDNYVSTITARATDIRGNENDSSFVWFKYDSSAPVTVIQVPDNDHNYNDSTYLLNMIYGTVSDAPQPYGNIKKVFVKIYNEVDGYWDGGGWGSEPDPLPEATIHPSSWTYTAIPGWMNEYIYDVWVYGVDIATNTEDEGSFHRFKFDNENPASRVTSISNNSYWNSPPDPILGTSQDSETGIEQVSIRLKYLNGGVTYYWNSVNWATPEKWLQTDNQTDPWTDNTNVPSSEKYVEGRIYYIVSRAADTRDRTGEESPPASCLNYETYSGNWKKYTWDIKVPTASITYPEPDGYVKEDKNIKGTCYDATGATYTVAGEIVIDGVINEVKVKLWKLIGADTYYWDNVTLSSWTTDVTWSTTTLSADATSWVLLHPEWETKDYRACAKAEDKTGSWQVVISTIKFTGDFAEPDSYIGKPVDEILYDNVGQIQGTAEDTGGEVNYVKIDMRKETNNYRWSGSTWVDNSDNPLWLETDGDTSWTYDIEYQTNAWDNGEWYEVISHAFDKAGNEESGEAKGVNKNRFQFTYPADGFKIENLDNTLTAGVAASFDVRAWNFVKGDQATGYTGTIKFYSDDSYVTFTKSSYTFTIGDGKDNGFHTFTGWAAFKTVGAKYLEVEDNETYAPETISSTSYRNVVPGALEYFKVSFPDEVTAGALTSVTGTAYDGQRNHPTTDGNKKTNYAGTVQFFGADGIGISLPADYTFTSGYGGADDGAHTWDSGVMISTANVGPGNSGASIYVKIQDGEKYGQKSNIKVYPAAMSFDDGGVGGFVVECSTGPWTAGIDYATVTVKAVDTYGNRLSTGSNIYAKTIKFTSYADDGEAVSKTRFGTSLLPTNYKFTTGQENDNGQRIFYSTASFRRKTANGSITAEDKENSAYSGEKTGIKVNAADMDHYDVSMETSCTAGVWYDVDITALDQFNNLKEMGQVTNITFECSLAAGEWANKGVYPLPESGQGTASEWVQLKKAGSGIWVKGKDASYEGTQTGIGVIAASAHHFKAYNYPSPVTAGETGKYVYAKMEDEFNNQYYHYTGTVTLNSNCQDVEYPGGNTYDFSDPNPEGGQPIQVVFNKAGSWDIYGSDEDDYGIIFGTQSNIQVNPAVASKFAVITSTNQTFGTRYTITVEALDTNNNRATDYDGKIHFTSDGTPVDLPADYRFTSGYDGSDKGFHSWTAPDYGVKFSTRGTWYVRAEDISGDGLGYGGASDGNNGQQPGIYVTTRPDSKLTFPVDNDDVNIISTTTYPIKGTCYDDISVSEVDIRIKRVGAQWWNEELNESAGGWQADMHWNSCNVFVDSWTYINTNPPWSSGNDYIIVSRAKDNKENYEISYDTITFKFDNQAPETSFTDPVQDGHRNALFRIEGEAVDQPAGYGAGLSYMELKIMEVQTDGTTDYWDSPSWQGDERWVYPTGCESPWVYSDTPTWHSGYFYNLWTWHRDIADNTESPYVKISFIYDSDAPDSYLGKPNQDFESDTTLTKIWGTAVDHPDSPNLNAGVDKVQVRISSGTGTGIFWNGSSWESTAPEDAWKDADWWASGSSWTYTSGIPGCFSDGLTYVVNSRAIDKTTSDGTSNPNVEVTITTHTFIYDTIHPIAYLTTPSDDSGPTPDYEPSELTTIAGTCSDTPPGSVEKVWVKIKGLGAPVDGDYLQDDTTTWSSTENWIDAGYFTSGVVSRSGPGGKSFQ